MLSVQDGMHSSYFWRLLLVHLCVGWMQWESNSFLQSRWYKPPNKQVLGFVFKTIDCTLFCAYTIVPSNVPFPDCKSDMFNFWTSMPPEETVICNQMNEKQMNEKQMNEKQNQELPTITLMHVMWSSGHIWKSLGSRIPLHTLHYACAHMWSIPGDEVEETEFFLESDFHSKWCWLLQGTLRFFLLRSNWEKENSRIALFVVYMFRNYRS